MAFDYAAYLNSLNRDQQYQLDEYGQPRQAYNEGGTGGYYLSDGTVTDKAPTPTFTYDAYTGMARPTYDATGTWTTAAMEKAIEPYGRAYDVDWSKYDKMAQLGMDYKNSPEYASDLAKSMQYNEYMQYMSTLEPWQKEAYKQIQSDYHDPNYRNVRFLSNGNIIKSEYGGEGAAGAEYVQNNPESDLWYGKYNPTTGDVKDWTYQEGIRTTGNEFAPYFMAAGTLLTGGLLAPAMVAGGVLGGAAIGGGLGALSSGIGSAIMNPGGGPDWGKVLMGAGTGAIGGAITGGGGLSGILGEGGEGAFTYGDLGDAASWADYWGDGAYSYGDFNNAGDWADYWGEGDVTYGDFDNAVEWEDYWKDAVDPELDTPEVDLVVEQQTGMNLEDLAKKVGTKAAQMLAKQMMGGNSTVTPVVGNSGSTATSAGNGLMAYLSSLGKSSFSSGTAPQLDIDQKLLAYKQAQIDPEYWRFMSTDQEA